MSNAEKPRRKETDIYCPLWQKPVSKVCHKCDWYRRLQGKDPQSEQIIDEWGCAIGFLPKLQIETSQMVRQATASTDKVATEVRDFKQGIAEAANKIQSTRRTQKVIDVE